MRPLPANELDPIGIRNFLFELLAEPLAELGEVQDVGFGAAGNKLLFSIENKEFTMTIEEV